MPIAYCVIVYLAAHFPICQQYVFMYFWNVHKQRQSCWLYRVDQWMVRILLDGTYKMIQGSWHSNGTAVVRAICQQTSKLWVRIWPIPVFVGCFPRGSPHGHILRCNPSWEQTPMGSQHTVRIRGTNEWNCLTSALTHLRHMAEGLLAGEINHTNTGINWNRTNKLNVSCTTVF